MSEITINEFKEDYIKIPLYDSNDIHIADLDKNQFLDVRTQIYLNHLEGYYVIFPNGQKGLINPKDGSVNNFPKKLWKTTLFLAQKLKSLMDNDVKNQKNIAE